MAGPASLKFALTSCLLAAALAGTAGAWARQDGPVAGDSAVVKLSRLPRPAQETYERIRLGGPFPYEKDGTVFGNRERLLPPQKRGHYREYTVATPGSRDRGARRIVCGGPPKAPEACYYTADHYGSFRKIVE